MNNIEKLEQLVRELYEAKDPNRDEWADWFYQNHVFIVGNMAEELALRFGADKDLARAAAILHDIADVKMPRVNPDHETESLQIARDLMQQAGYDAQIIVVIVDDAIRYHSCHDGKVPESLEGKVLATADALAHLQTDFYIYAPWAMGTARPLDGIKEWARKKLDRDYYDKIAFDEVRADAEDDYKALKRVYSK